MTDNDRTRPAQPGTPTVRRAATPIAPAREGLGSGTVSVRGTATLEFVSPTDGAPYACPATGHVATSVKMGLFDHGWDDNDNFQNEPVEANHVAGADSRRFYLRVVDESARGRAVEVHWRTRTPPSGTTPGTLLDGAVGNTITLTRLSGTSTFVSRGLMVVSSTADLAQAIHSGDIPGGRERSRGEADFRLRIATMFDVVEAEYEHAPAPVSVPVFLPADRRSFGVQVYFVDGPNVNAALAALWSRDLRVAREVYGRHGIWMWTAQPAAAAQQRIVANGPDHAAVVPPPPRVAWPATTYDQMLDGARALTDRYRAQSSAMLRAFYMGYNLPTTDRGDSYVPSYNRFVTENTSLSMTRPAEPETLLATSLISATHTPYTLAHELGHLLFDMSPVETGQGHYTGPHMGHNLMHAPTDDFEDISTTSRLVPWQVNALAAQTRFVVR